MHRLKLILPLLLVISALWIGACLGNGGPRGSFSIAWNYDTSGYLEVCGCSAHQLGGFPRRATKLETLESAQPVLKLEGAHIFEEAGTFQMMKGEAIVKALNLMEYNALVLGVREAQQGREGLDRLKAIATFPLVSANLYIDGACYAEPGIHVEIAGNDVFVTAASQPEFVTFDLPAGVTIEDPRQSLDAALSKKGRADMVIICLEGDELWLEDMKEEYSGKADLFLTGSRDALAASLDWIPDPPSINNWKLGRYMSLVSADPLDKGGYSLSGVNLPLSEDLADNAAISAVLDEFKSGLKDVFAEIMPFDEDALYFPPEYCQACHQQEYESYKKSGHSLARVTLEKENQLYNLDCIKCHIVYDPDENELNPINCITCHTNIVEQHVYDAMDDPAKIVAPNPPATSYTYEFCSKCHDEINSTPFKEHWPQYVNRVFHGGDMSNAEKAADMLGIDITADPPGHEGEAGHDAEAMAQEGDAATEAGSQTQSSEH